MSEQAGFFEVVKARRSVRRFTDDPVPMQVLQAIVAAGLEAPTGCNAQFRQYMILTRPAVMDRLRAVSPALATASAAIVQLIEPKTTSYGDYYLQDAAASVENMLLATVALGYASCWVEGQVRPSHQEIRQILGVPDDVNVSAILPIGKPAQTPNRPTKLTVAQATHYDRYGNNTAPDLPSGS